MGLYGEIKGFNKDEKGYVGLYRISEGSNQDLKGYVGIFIALCGIQEVHTDM